MPYQRGLRHSACHRAKPEGLTGLGDHSHVPPPFPCPMDGSHRSRAAACTRIDHEHHAEYGAYTPPLASILARSLIFPGLALHWSASQESHGLFFCDC